MLDIDQLRTFLAVVETQSFTRAGDRVAKTQSAVSMQMKKLEEMVGRPLFTREGRGIAVSDDGIRLIPYARDIVERSAEALAAFDDTALRGQVHLGTADDYAERLLPAILAGFSQTHPLVEVSVNCEDSYQLGEVDMAVGTHTEVARRPELIRTDRLLWVTSARHIVHTAKVVPLALGSPHCIWRMSALEALTRAGVEHRLRYASYSATVVGAAVLAGLAVAVLPESALRPGMRVLDSHNRFPPLPDCEIGLLHGHKEKTDASRALADHIRTCIQSLPAMSQRPDGSYIEFAMDPFAAKPMPDFSKPGAAVAVG